MKIILSYLLMLSISYSFTFDKWHSGQTWGEVVQFSEDINLPIHTHGIASGNKDFIKNITIDRHSKNKLIYMDTLLGEHTENTLFFTKTSKKIYKISIRFVNTKDKKSLDSNIIRGLSKKYGKSKPEPLTINTFIFPKRGLLWIKNSDYIIFNPGMYGKIIYTDNILANLNENEILKTKKKVKEKNFVRDSNRL